MGCNGCGKSKGTKSAGKSYPKQNTIYMPKSRRNGVSSKQAVTIKDTNGKLLRLLK